MPTCPNCRVPLDVPEDCTDASIRCGICWAKVALDPPSQAPGVPPVAESAGPQPAVAANPFIDVPAMPLPGMQPFEDVLRALALRLPSLFVPPPPVLRPIPPETVPSAPFIEGERLDDDHGELRRRRGVRSTPMPRESRASVLGMYQEESAEAGGFARWLFAAGAGLLVFAIALAVFRFVL